MDHVSAVSVDHSMSSTVLLAIFTGVILSSSPATAAITSQFQEFYPQYGDKYKIFLETNCSQQFADYLAGQPKEVGLTYYNWVRGAGHTSILIEPVVNCLLEQASEYIKAASASAQVLLGFTPTLLSSLGSTTDELGLLAVVGGRPLLSLVLSLGSPSVFLARAFEFRDPAEILRPRPGRYQLPTSSWAPAPAATSGGRHYCYYGWAIAAVQYALALAAAANVVALSLQLGVRCVSSFWSDSVYAPLTWGLLSVPINVLGTAVVRLRMERISSSSSSGTGTITSTSTSTSTSTKDLSSNTTTTTTSNSSPLPLEKENKKKTERLIDSLLRGGGTAAAAARHALGACCAAAESGPCIAQADELRVRTCDEGPCYVALSWLLGTLSSVDFLFGTLLLSSLEFIGTADALGVIARYMASALVCRAVLMFEIVGMRARLTGDPGDHAD
ncbi:hypothetical protein GGR56DRAFT_143073 [Xylariaceae sp. FL0804]|nr:hypothetical protein GGR56DRAFT_143073 [Xylariaceae sp. FL0804]